MVEGRLRAGAVVSSTVTVKEPDADCPPESVTEQLTVVVPNAKMDPEMGEHDGVGSGSS